MGLEYKRIMTNEARTERYLTKDAGKGRESTDQESRKVNAGGNKERAAQKSSFGIPAPASQ